MMLKEIRIKRFRSIWDESITVEPLTGIVGPNGAGKSTVLSALKEFYATSRTVSTDDFYNRDRGQTIEIALTFTRLSQPEQALFGSYMDGDTLTITKVIGDTAEKYHGVTVQHPEFARVREIVSKRDRSAAYNQCRDQIDEALPQARSADDADAAMRNWEEMHPGRCERIRDDGQFFGFRNVGQAKLEKHTRFVLVPAVRDAENDAADRKGSAIFELMEMVVRTVIARDQRMQELKQRTQAELAEIVGPNASRELTGLSNTLTQVLQTYVPTAAVKLIGENYLRLIFRCLLVRSN